MKRRKPTHESDQTLSDYERCSNPTYDYNARVRAAEVMVDGDQTHLVRRRETIEEMYAQESVIPE